jgi:predicted CopG family antitoxin
LSAHESSRQEIADLLAIADRDLRDCQSEGLSADWKFNIAYNALLQAAAAALAAAGYRASRESHHYRVLRSLGLTVAASPEVLRQFEAFRKKRNLTGYERVGTVSDREVAEIIEAARDVRRQVEKWIKASHPELL